MSSIFVEKRIIRQIVKRRLWGEKSMVIADDLKLPRKKVSSLWLNYWRRCGVVKYVLVSGYGRPDMEVTLIERPYIRPIRKVIKKKNNHNIKSTLREREREYRRSNINFRIANNLRGRLRMALKSQGTLKSNATLTYLGCNKEFFKNHLKSKFKEGMTFDNYGTWHIDHIKPLSRFDLTKEEEIHLAMHYSNLQPLWAKENLRKNAYFEP